MPNAQERNRAACPEAPASAPQSGQPLNLSQLIRSHGMTLIYAARKLSLTYSALSQPRTMWRQSEHRKLFQLEAILGITHADMIGALEESARQAAAKKLKPLDKPCGGGRRSPRATRGSGSGPCAVAAPEPRVLQEAV